jgi:hypothetical protein
MSLPPPRKLGGPGGAPGAGGARPARPAMKPPPVSAGSMMLRKMLMLFIIFACLGLGGAIAYKLWRAAHPVEKSASTSTASSTSDGRAKGASKDIFRIQTKVWGKNEELKPDDFATIKKQLASCAIATTRSRTCSTSSAPRT